MEQVLDLSNFTLMPRNLQLRYMQLALSFICGCMTLLSSMIALVIGWVFLSVVLFLFSLYLCYKSISKIEEFYLDLHSPLLTY